MSETYVTKSLQEWVQYGRHVAFTDGRIAEHLYRKILEMTRPFFQMPGDPVVSIPVTQGEKLILNDVAKYLREQDLV